jgi:hypothetical protein
MTESVVRVKDGVEFTVIAPAGFRILSAIDQAAATLGRDLVITSACDGLHSGPNDPHHLGRAFDIRSHDIENKQETLDAIMKFLGAKFFGFLESPNTDNEHFHIQIRQGEEL